jgi:hypothetical protein
MSERKSIRSVRTDVHHIWTKSFCSIGIRIDKIRYQRSEVEERDVGVAKQIFRLNLS